MSERSKRKGRLAIYSTAGFYLLYNAYAIYTDGIPHSQGGERTLLWVSMIAFVIIGVGGIVWSLREIYLLQKEDREAQENAAKEQSGNNKKAVQEEPGALLEKEPDSDEVSAIEEKEKLPEQ